MKVADFDYFLPKNLIAKRPLKERSLSRLLVLHRDGKIEHQRFVDLPSYLNSGDMILLNNSKVFPARIIGHKKTGGKIEILLVKKLDENTWEVLSKGAYTGTVKITDDFYVELYQGKTACFVDSGDFMDIIWRHGYMPLPQYIRRLPDESDKETYQTIYAKQEGSIAAPTAGLHFSDALLKELISKGIKVRELTLHVGVGTFKPVKSVCVEEHSMDAEYFEIDKNIISEIEATKASGKKIIAVGTTTTRAIEGYMSSRCYLTSRNGRIYGSTDIFIYPGYSFKIIDSLVTNFHLPRSTPLMLTSSLCGWEKLMQVYQEAIAKGYRFLSYGDAMLIV
jgi:S-adenosylmethionine:tRNA ribosyltransferase-isomerase